MKRKLLKILPFVASFVLIFSLFAILSSADNSPPTYSNGDFILNTDIDYFELFPLGNSPSVSYYGLFAVDGYGGLQTTLTISPTYNNGSLFLVDYYISEGVISTHICTVNPNNGNTIWDNEDFKFFTGYIFAPANLVVSSLSSGGYSFSTIPRFEFTLTASSSDPFISNDGKAFATTIQCFFDSAFNCYNLYFGDTFIGSTLNNIITDGYDKIFFPFEVFDPNLNVMIGLNNWLSPILSGDEYTVGYNEGYRNGLSANTESSFNSGYNAGLTEGYDSGYDVGYQDGKEYGLSINDNAELAYNEGFNDGLEEGYDNGYIDGRAFGEIKGYDIGFKDGKQVGYSDGYSDGVNKQISDSFGDSLLGDTIRQPLEALNSFVIYESSNGVVITLGLVLGGLLGLTVLIAFLKLFAGG